MNAEPLDDGVDRYLGRGSLQASGELDSHDWRLRKAGDRCQNHRTADIARRFSAALAIAVAYSLGLSSARCRRSFGHLHLRPDVCVEPSRRRSSSLTAASMSAQPATAISQRRSRRSMRVSNGRRAALVALIVLLFATSAGAQVVGAILTGTVTDPSGAAALNAAVTIRNVETGIVTVTQTNAAGIYSTPNLLPGEYTISAEASGLTSGEFEADAHGGREADFQHSDEDRQPCQKSSMSPPTRAPWNSAVPRSATSSTAVRPASCR